MRVVSAQDHCCQLNSEAANIYALVHLAFHLRELRLVRLRSAENKHSAVCKCVVCLEQTIHLAHTTRARAACLNPDALSSDYWISRADSDAAAAISIMLMVATLISLARKVGCA